LSININAGDWLDFIGSILGVLGAFLIANYQLRKEKERIEKEKRSQVLLGSKRYKNINFDPGYDIYTQEESLNNSDLLSEMKIKIVNVGSSTIYNARVRYDFPNIDNYLDTYKNKSKASETFRFEKDENKTSFFLEENKQRKRYYLRDYYYSNEISYLFSGQEQEVRIPTFYLFLLQYYLVTLYSERMIEGSEDIKKPILKATLDYENYKFEEKKEIYYITYSSFDMVRSESETEIDIAIKPYREEKVDINK